MYCNKKVRIFRRILLSWSRLTDLRMRTYWFLISSFGSKANAITWRKMSLASFLFVSISKYTISNVVVFELYYIIACNTTISQSFTPNYLHTDCIFVITSCSRCEGLYSWSCDKRPARSGIGTQLRARRERRFSGPGRAMLRSRSLSFWAYTTAIWSSVCGTTWCTGALSQLSWGRGRLGRPSLARQTWRWALWWMALCVTTILIGKHVIKLPHCMNFIIHIKTHLPIVCVIWLH